MALVFVEGSAGAVGLPWKERGDRPKKVAHIRPQAQRHFFFEGEQEVIAFVGFIPEASLKSRPVPIVLEDPVNGLDYKRLQYVAARIAQMTRSRQVIVFTHNIWFACELLSHIEKDKSDDATTTYPKATRLEGT